jgi:ferric-dicitrate binding protein FerR (iron transport regulator)
MERKMKNTDDIVKFIAGCDDTKLKEKILSDIDRDNESEQVYNKVKVAWAFLASVNKMPEYKIEKSYKKFQTRINLRPTRFLFKVNNVLKYAAILVLFFGILSLVFYIENQSTNETELRYTSVVAKYKQISQVILPDSSIVWLNSGTTLRYDNNYSLNNRDLSIRGEAYLEVRKNRKIPLIVTCNELKVKVLGTKFNVSAYPDDDKVTVSLESGSVELLHTKNRSFDYKLRPGEMAQYDTVLKDIAIKKTNVNDYTVWKDGVLVFKDTPMEEVFKRIERKFDVNIVVENPTVYEPAFNATFKNENLVEVLDYIQYSCHVRYKISKDNTDKIKIKLY